MYKNIMNARTIALVLKSLNDTEMARFAEILSRRDSSMLERAYSPIKKDLIVYDMEKFREDVRALRPGIEWTSFDIRINSDSFEVELYAYYKAKGVYTDKSVNSSYEAIKTGNYSLEPAEGLEEIKCSDSMYFTNILKAEDYCTWETL